MAYDLAIDTRLNTFAVKDELKAIGCRWNKDLCAWMAKDDTMFNVGMEIARATGEAAWDTKPLRGKNQSQKFGEGDYYASGRYDAES